MSRSIVIRLTILALYLPHVALAGVAMDMVTSDTSGKEKARTSIFAQAGKIRMDEQDRGGRTSVIFLGNQFLVLDHKDKSYILMDEAMLNELTSQISAAMQQMEAQLAGLPPEQRAMAEQMMKGQMGGMMGEPGDSAPKTRVEAIGSSQWKTFSCKNYAVYEGGEKSQEVCAASLDQIDGSAEMMQAFRGMAAFINRMTESVPMGPGINPGELMDQIDGFPVHTTDYRGGEIAGEVALESVVEQAIDEAMFAPPEGYSRQDPFAGRR